jgi:hypothetical protein
LPRKQQARTPTVLVRRATWVQGMAMTASLIMYARPELELAHARLWDRLRDGLRRRGIAAPDALDQTSDGIWEDPALVFSQTCGMPYRTRLHGQVNLVCTPDYGLEDCPPGHYRSAIVVRTDDPRAALLDFAGATLAYNEDHSQSGFAAMYSHVQPFGWRFGRHLASGGHLHSARLVARGEADIAALDAQSWRLIRRYEDWAHGLRVLEYTEPTPGLPYITGARQDADLVSDTVQEAIGGLSAEDAQALDLKGVVRIPHAAYMAVPNPPAGALDQPALRRQTM